MSVHTCQCLVLIGSFSYILTLILRPIAPSGKQAIYDFSPINLIFGSVTLAALAFKNQQNEGNGIFYFISDFQAVG